jgi:RimJ/RimL family protein N-acetyltransferase
MTDFSSHGQAVSIRPIQPSDYELERAFVRGLSPASGTNRLMSPRTPSDEEIHHWTEADPQREGALIATIDVQGQVQQVGVARYVIDDSRRAAEFAIVLADAWQGRGLGSALLAELIARARQAGLRQLFGMTLWENRAMIELARRHGFTVRRDPESAAIRLLTLELDSGNSAAPEPAAD